MKFIAFKAPENLKKTVKQEKRYTLSELTFVDDVKDFNTISGSETKCIVAFGCSEQEARVLSLKVGSNGVIHWVNSPQKNVLQNDTSTFYTLDLSNTTELVSFVESVLVRFNRKQSGTQTENVLKRLELIHGITQIALNITAESEITQKLLSELQKFYQAESVSLLNYNEEHELILVQRITKEGLVENNINQRVQNQNEYEECIECGDTIVNCKEFEPGKPNYLCAPIYSPTETIGVLRLEYIAEAADISVDKVVLRICSDILSTTYTREKTTRALHESEKRAGTILNTTVDAIISIDERGAIDSFNRAAEMLFGYKEMEVLGKNIQILMPQPYAEEHDEYIRRYQNTGERQIIGIGREVSGKRKNGSVFPMYLAVSEFVVDGKKMFTGIVRDISEQRKLEQEVMRISEHERHRIGQDLHDGLGQMLSGIGMLTKRIENKLRGESHTLATEVEEI